MTLLLMSGAIAQDEKAVPTSRGEVTLSYAPVVKKAAPAVVNIYTKARVTVQEQQNLSPFMNDPFFSQFFNQGFRFGTRPQEKEVTSLGSGVIIDPSGQIVTSYHVINEAQEIRVVLNDKREFPASVVFKDKSTDLAFLKIEAPGKLPALTIRDSDTVEVGDIVLAIGNPFGVGQTVTEGIVSGLARKAAGVSDYSYFIQTDAAINPGNSGGALVDMQGRLIGINTAIYSKSGGSMGIGFAIPSNMVRSLMGGKVEAGRVVHPWLGVGVQPVTVDIAESLGLDAPQGVIVRQIVAGSSAETAGLKVGDVVLSIDGSAITSEADMQYRLALGRVGDNSEFKLLRDGKPVELSVPLSAPPENPKRDIRVISGKNPLTGVKLANMSPALALELNLNAAQAGSGVIVLASGGLGLFAPGDYIVDINGVKITSTAQLEKLMKAGARSWKIIYRRGGNLMTLSVSM